MGGIRGLSYFATNNAKVMVDTNPFQSSAVRSPDGDAESGTKHKALGKLATIPLGSLSIVVVSTWTVTLIAVVRLLDLPGGLGPVQYADGNQSAEVVFGLRVVTFMAMLAAPVIAGVFGAVSAKTIGGAEKVVWRFAAWTLYLFAWITLFGTEFFPTA